MALLRWESSLEIPSRTQKIGHGLNEQTISQLWSIHQKAEVAEVAGEQHLGLACMGSPVKCAAVNSTLASRNTRISRI